MFAHALQGETEGKSKRGITDGANKSKQASLFEQQLDLAVELGLNVVIHQRDSLGQYARDHAPYTVKLCVVFFIVSAARLEEANEVLAIWITSYHSLAS